MSDIRQYEPLWGSWYIDGEPLGEGSYGKVYKVYKEEFGNRYFAAVKMISVPQTEADLAQVRNDGLDDASARSYFQAFVTDIVQEIDLMSAFRGNTNIVSLEDHKVIEKKDSIGWDILIRMELLTTLSSYYNRKPLTPVDVMQVGIDISRALELCAVRKTIHRDIKPDNIFVSQYGDYKLGDFGIARQIERTMSGLSKKGTYTYMAPEVYKGEDYGPSVDLYSLGIVMYRYLNKNRTPFMPPFPQTAMPQDRDQALKRRMEGEALPDIPDIDPRLNEFVLKACAYKREDRFTDATEFRTELEKIAGAKPKPPVQEVQREPVKATVKKPRAMRQEEEEATVGVFAINRDAPVGEVPEARPEVPHKIMNILAVCGAVFCGILTLLSLMSGSMGDVFVSMPLYALCVAQCVINFRHPALNATLIIWLVCYLAFSVFMDFGAFDYSLLTLVLGILGVEAMRSSSRKYQLALSITLGVCALVSGVLIFNAIGQSSSPMYRAFIGASGEVPLLMLIVSVMMLLPRSDDGRILAGLMALQAFEVVVLVLMVVLSMGSPVPQVLVNMADASFVGLSPERFRWWTFGRFLGLMVQVIAVESLVCVAAAKMIPSDFLALMSNRKAGIISAGVTLAVMAAGIILVALIAAA